MIAKHDRYTCCWCGTLGANLWHTRKDFHNPIHTVLVHKTCYDEATTRLEGQLPVITEHMELVLGENNV